MYSASTVESATVDCFLLLQQTALGFFQPERQVIKALLPLVDAVHHARESTLLRGDGQHLSRHQQAVTHGSSQALVHTARLLFQFLA